jgi:two-component system, cell cycle sensor histidine kinase and response regulator CckA
MEIPIHTRDEKTRVISWHAVPLMNQEGELAGVVAFGRDVTNQMKLQSEVMKAKKLEAVGALAGGIAHNFNNLLTGVLGNIALAREVVGHDSEAQELLREAEEASLRARDLTGQLLTFAQGGAPVRKPRNMASLLRDSVRTLWGRSGVSIESIIPDSLWPAEVDERQLNQAIHNLIRRARQVTPAGEIVHLVARNVTLGADEGLPLPDGRYVEILVGDRGPEIPAQLLDNVVDPFFPANHDANSLGLAVAYSIVRAHHGYIYVDSEPDCGTTFHMLVPAMEAGESAYSDTGESGTSEEYSARILLMDDQRMVQQVAGHMLRRLKHVVDFADDGAEAIGKYRDAMTSDAPYDIVIMDLTVPEGMGGLTAIGQLIQIDPDVKAIVSSGYSSDPVMANYESFGFRSVLAKPYLLEDLRAAISEVLADPPSRR